MRIELGRWSSVGQVLVKCWSSVGQVLVKCWSSVGQVLFKCWSSIGQALVNCWSSASVGQALVKHWSNVGQVLVTYGKDTHLSAYDVSLLCAECGCTALDEQRQLVLGVTPQQSQLVPVPTARGYRVSKKKKSPREISIIWSKIKLIVLHF